VNETAAGPGLEEFSLPGEEDVEVTEEKVGGLALLDSNTALGAVDRAAIDVQINTAKQFPRSITKSMREAQSMACVDAKTAETMVYALKRGKGRDAKIIEGPSVRLAEIMVYSFGNMRIDADIVGQDKQFVTAMGTCFDLEKNVATRIRVKRRITDKHGRTYSEDMIGVTANAAISIALRNAVFKTIPFSLTNRIYQDARAAMLGKGTLKEKRTKVFEHFGKLGVKPEEIFALLEVRGEDDILEDQLVTLRGFANAIKEGEMTVESVFRSEAEQTSAGTDQLNAELKKSRQSGTPAKAKTSPDVRTADCVPQCTAEKHHPDCKHFADEA
jgi:hypothetical protein